MVSIGTTKDLFVGKNASFHFHYSLNLWIARFLQLQSSPLLARTSKFRLRWRLSDPWSRKGMAFYSELWRGAAVPQETADLGVSTPEVQPLTSSVQPLVFLVVSPRGSHPFPSRTRKLSSAGPMILHG